MKPPTHRSNRIANFRLLLALMLATAALLLVASPRQLVSALRGQPGEVAKLGLAPVLPLACTFTVTNTNDSGAGSLRQAILDANANLGTDSICFSVPGGGVQTI